MINLTRSEALCLYLHLAPLVSDERPDAGMADWVVFSRLQDIYKKLKEACADDIRVHVFLMDMEDTKDE